MQETQAPAVEVEAPPPPKRERLVSLDAFRGLTVLGMLLVNNISLDEQTPKALTHAEWSGAVHLADLVFPWFLFAVGVAIPIADARRGNVPFRKILSRTLLLVILGMVVDSAVLRTPTFGLGVLQLIGLSYGIGALISYLGVLYRIFVAMLFLGIHWALLKHYPVPGIGPGVVDVASNAIDYLNQAYLEPIGLRGILSLLPTAAMVLIGTAIGSILESKRAVLGVAGSAALLVALGLAWSLDLPMNKPIWTGSYILYAAGLGAMALGAFFAVADWGKQRWLVYPLVVAGANAIVAYVAPILVKVMILQQWKWPGSTTMTLEQGFQKSCSDALGYLNGAWLYTGCYLGFWWLVLFILYRRRVFVRV